MGHLNLLRWIRAAFLLLTIFYFCQCSVPANREYSLVVSNLQTMALINSTLRNQIIHSIEQSTTHGINSSSPWKLEDLFDAFERYLTYLPVPDNPFAYAWNIGDIL